MGLFRERMIQAPLKQETSRVALGMADEAFRDRMITAPMKPHITWRWRNRTELSLIA